MKKFLMNQAKWHWEKKLKMIKPEPFKLKCPKCNHKEIVKPKSDVVDYSYICPKCNELMIRKPLNSINKIIIQLFEKYWI